MRNTGTWLVAVLAVGVTASLAVAAGQTVWHLAGETSVAARAVPARVSVPEPTTVSRDTTSITALSPFGTATPAPRNELTPEVTTLGLRLHGVLVQANPEMSSALISSGAETLRYGIGETIADKAVLVEIEDLFVVLDVDGTQQTLGFPNSEVAPLETEQIAEAPAEQSNMDRLRTALGVGSGSIEVEDAPPPVTTDDYINMWRERIIRNPNQVLGEIGLIASENGYTVDENYDPGVKLAGLEAGDTVARVNGQAVGNVEQDRKFFDDVAASGVARLEVVRGDRTFVLSFPLR